MSDFKTLGNVVSSDQIVALLDQPAMVLDAAGTVTAVNEAYRRLTTRQKSEIVGERLQHALDHNAAASLASILAVVARGIESGTGPPPQEIDVTAFGAVVSMLIHPLQDSATGAALYLCLGQSRDTASIENYNDLRNRELRWRVALESAGHAVWDAVGSQTQFVSDEWFRMRGLTRETTTKDAPIEWLDEVHEEDQALIEANHAKMEAENSDEVSYQYRQRHKDGHWIWVMSRGRIVTRDMNGLPHRIIGIDTDITELKLAEAETKAIAQRLSISVAASGIGIWDMRLDCNEIHWTDTMFTIYGIQRSQPTLDLAFWQARIHPADAARAEVAFETCLKDHRDFRFELRILRPCGVVAHIRRFGRCVFGPDRRVSSILGVDIDITADVERADALEQARAAMEYDSRHDALTGLGNRRLLDETFVQFCERNATTFVPHTVLHLDVDFFKQVNDRFGHTIGDELLRHIAAFITQIVGDRGLVARVGGDEFVLFLPNIVDAAALRTLTEEIVAHAGKPFRYEGVDCSYGISLGVASRYTSSEDPSRIFVDADLALYHAKTTGRSRFSFFDDSMRMPGT